MAGGGLVAGELAVILAVRLVGIWLPVASVVGLLAVARAAPIVVKSM